MDEDFLVEGAQRQLNGMRFSTVVFARPMEITIGRCVRDLKIVARAAMPEEQFGQVVYLPL